jgi:hypothetical protein
MSNLEIFLFIVCLSIPCPCGCALGKSLTSFRVEVGLRIASSTAGDICESFDTVDLQALGVRL